MPSPAFINSLFYSVCLSVRLSAYEKFLRPEPSLMVVEPVQLKMIDARDGNNCHRYQVLGGGRCNPFTQAPSSPFHPSTLPRMFWKRRGMYATWVNSQKAIDAPSMLVFLNTFLMIKQMKRIQCSCMIVLSERRRHQRCSRISRSNGNSEKKQETMANLFTSLWSHSPFS